MTPQLRDGLLGLALGLALGWTGAAQPEHVRRTLTGKSWGGARTVLYTLGLGMGLTALLCWLAVIDVDLLQIPPLTAGVLAGAVLFGAAVGFGGQTPFTMLAGVGADRLLPSLCGVAGCLLGAWLGRFLPAPGAWQLFAPIQGTLFRLTLTDPYLLDGSFLALACTGAVLCVLALFIRPRSAVPQEAPIPAEPQEPEAQAPIMTDHPENDPTPVPETSDMAEVLGGAMPPPGPVPEGPATPGAVPLHNTDLTEDTNDPSPTN